MTNNVALITGISGMDGSHLAELLLSKNYEVHGMLRRSSSFNTWRIDHLYKDVHEDCNLKLHYGDLNDSSSLMNVIQKVQPDEIYNLGAMSHVQVSFEVPEYTANSDAIGVLRVLEAVRLLGIKDVKIYNAASSEMFGKVQETPQTENTPFYPRSPYASAKAYGFYITRNYREAYNMFASNGILFNHEGPRRGQTFVTRKITMGLSKIKLGKQDVLYLGNINSKRDFGYAPEFVNAMWKILQYDKPDDFIIATGETHSVREFINETCKCLDIDLEWSGEGLTEVGLSDGKEIIKIDPKYFRPAEVDLLLGDYSKAKRELNWEPKVKFKELVKIMAEHDYDLIKSGGIIY